MKYLKKKKGLYAYSGTDSEAIQFLNAFKQVFYIDLLPYLESKPIDFGDLLRTFDEDGVINLPLSSGNEGNDNVKKQIDNGNLPLMTKINGLQGNIIGYIYELKNWYSNKLSSGKVVLMPAEGFGMQYKEPYYIYVANRVYTPAQKSVIFNKEFDEIYKNLGGIPANKTAGSIAAWENYLTNPAENSRVKNFDTIYYKGFWEDFFAFYKSKRLMAASQGSTTTGGTGAASGTSTGTGTVDTSGGTLNTDKLMTEADMTETDARAFLYEIEKYSPLIWANLDYWYKNLMAKKKEVTKEVFNFAYDYWLKKLNAQYETFSPLEKENEKERYSLINGYIFEKPKKVKKYGLFASILRAIFKKK